MDKQTLANDERMALRLWCRQALAQLEQEELKDRLLKMQAEDEVHEHRISKIRKRPSRATTSRVKELVH
jgi:hypothetical protein